MSTRALQSYEPNRVGTYAVSGGLLGALLGGAVGFWLQGTYCTFGKGAWAPGGFLCTAPISSVSTIGGVMYMTAALGALGLGYLGSRYDR